MALMPPSATTPANVRCSACSNSAWPATRWHWHGELPLFSLWRAAREQHDDPNPAAWVGEGALLTRPHDQVLWAPLSAGGCALLDACAAGHPIADAVQTALTREPEMDLAATLALLLTQGAFTHTEVTEDPT